MSRFGDRYQVNAETKDDDCLSTCSLLSTSKKELESEEVQEDELDLRKAKLLMILGISLTIPSVLIEIFYDYGFSMLVDYIIIALASSVQFILGKPFYLRFCAGLRKQRIFTISTLVMLSTTVAYSYTIIAIIMGQDIRFFEASASVLTIFTIGVYLERRVLRTTSESIKKLLTLKPKKAVVIRNGSINGKDEEEQEITIDADEIVVGDIVVVKPGETIATDGIVIAGESSVDESMITGESIPVDKEIGVKVIGGTVNMNGYLKFRAINVGSHTVLANIIEMVWRARSSKPSIQKIADRLQDTLYLS